MKVLSVNLNRSKNSRNFAVVSDSKIPSPNKNEILFKTVACGVCATDIETLITKKEEDKWKKAVHGKMGNKYLGHEIVGRAIKVGKNISQNFVSGIVLGPKNIKQLDHLIKSWNKKIPKKIIESILKKNII
jgi:D-arabinose 1-dehydrogenase-like Zn-dependent alcohol dehydrogenase